MSIQIGFLVDGVTVSAGTVDGSDSRSIVIRAGQSLELDADEPVYWTLQVGGTDVTGDGTTVHYAGADITLLTETDSRILVDTAASGYLSQPVPIRLVATSTIDSAQVVVVDVLITN